MKSFQDACDKLQFTKGEKNVYLALLELGESTIGNISKNAKITPSKTYPILDKLQERGLISTAYKGEIKHFTAHNLQHLQDALSAEIQSQQKILKNLKKDSPALQKQFTNDKQEYLAIYEGLNGLRALYNRAIEDLKKTGERFLAFSLTTETEYQQALPFFTKYDEMRSKAGIRTQILAPSNLAHLQKKLDSKYIELKFIVHPLPTGAIVFGNNVVHLMWKNTPKAFLTHSQQLAEVYKELFDTLWNEAK